MTPMDEARLEQERLAAYRTARRIADALRHPPFDESGPETVGWNDALARFISVIDKKIIRLEETGLARGPVDDGSIL